MNVYCKSCGGPNTYGSKKPKFCNNCGSSLDSTAKAKIVEVKPKKTTKPAQTQASHQDDDYEDEPAVIPDISKLDFDITASSQLRGVKIGDVAGTASEDGESYIRPAEESDSKEALKQVKEEGGAIRPKESS